MCDQGKHLSLSKRTNPATHVWSGCLGGAPVGELTVGGGDKWVITSESSNVDIEGLAERVLAKWESFFLKHNI